MTEASQRDERESLILVVAPGPGGRPQMSLLIDGQSFDISWESALMLQLGLTDALVMARGLGMLPAVAGAH